jgi:hypothetical protein
VPAPKPARKKGNDVVEKEKNDTRSRGRSSEDSKGEKDADVIVVDASVLVHAIYQVKKWCRDGREEVIIVPLEGIFPLPIPSDMFPINYCALSILALNTLDLLKKGTSALAQRARAASRILEAQVGTNPRILVQRDDAFVLWDNIPFIDPPVPTDNGKDASSMMVPVDSSPEWLRRTICCARWEVDHANQADNDIGIAKTITLDKRKVLLAVLASSPVQLSQETHTVKLSDTTSNAILPSPVPLPAPHVQAGKHEPRSAGNLVSHWAAKAGIEMLQVWPTQPNGSPPHPAPNSKLSEDEERPRRISPHTVVHGPQGGRGRRNSHHSIAPAGGGGCSNTVGMGLVERPAAVMAMMERVSQPSKVVRVLARGEKLDPDP